MRHNNVVMCVIVKQCESNEYKTRPFTSRGENRMDDMFAIPYGV